MNYRDNTGGWYYSMRAEQCRGKRIPMGRWGIDGYDQGHKCLPAAVLAKVNGRKTCDMWRILMQHWIATCLFDLRHCAFTEAVVEMISNYAIDDWWFDVPKKKAGTELLTNANKAIAKLRRRIQGGDS